MQDVTLTELQQDSLRSLRLVGDLAHQSGEMSLEMLEEDVGDLGKDLGIDHDVVAKALIGQNLIGIPTTRHAQFLRLAFRRQEYKRAIIHKVITDLNDFGFTDVEKMIISAFLSAAHLFDELFYDWRERVVESDLGKQAEADPAFMTNFRKVHGLSLSPYSFSIIVEKDSAYVEQTLIEAFPEIVAEIINVHKKLASDLRAAQAPEHWTHYVDALVALFENNDPLACEALAKKLDTLFLGVQGRLIPVNAMEVYDDPGKYCVTPEMRLCVVDDRYAHVNEGIEHTRANVMTRLTELYKDVPALQASLPQMKRAQAAAYTTLSEAGASMTLRPFGENIPNWDDIRADVGVRIFIFMETAKTRWVGERAVLRKVLGDEVVEKYFDPYTESEQFFDYAGIVAVGGHEVAHNAFITEGVSERLTPPLYAKIEEHKANLAILSEIDHLYSPKEQQIIVLYELGYSLMKMAQARDSTVVAYVNYSIFAINAFLQAQILVPQGKGFALDLAPAKLQAWIDLLKVALADLVPIYDHGTAEQAAAYIDKYFAPSPVVDGLIKSLAV